SGGIQHRRFQFRPVKSPPLVSCDAVGIYDLPKLSASRKYIGTDLFNPFPQDNPFQIFTVSKCPAPHTLNSSRNGYARDFLISVKQAVRNFSHGCRNKHVTDHFLRLYVVDHAIFPGVLPIRLLLLHRQPRRLFFLPRRRLPPLHTEKQVPDFLIFHDFLPPFLLIFAGSRPDIARIFLSSAPSLFPLLSPTATQMEPAGVCVYLSASD